MEIHFIEKGTLFYINILAESPDVSLELNGSLHEIKGNTKLSIEGSDLHEYCMKQSAGLRLSITFFRGVKKFSFYGKLERTLIKHGVMLTEITATSRIEEKNRRSFPRLRVSMPVKLYALKKDNTTELLCSGEAFDISLAAICFLTKGRVKIPDNSIFYVEFSIRHTDHFYLLAKLERKGNAPQSVRFKHDYVFLFDYSENQEEKNRLLDSFLKKT